MENQDLRSKKVFLSNLELHILAASIPEEKHGRDTKDMERVIPHLKLPNHLQNKRILLPQLAQALMPLILIPIFLLLHPLVLTLTCIFFHIPTITLPLQLITIQLILQSSLTLVSPLMKSSIPAYLHLIQKLQKSLMKLKRPRKKWR